MKRACGYLGRQMSEQVCETHARAVPGFVERFQMALAGRRVADATAQHGSLDGMHLVVYVDACLIRSTQKKTAAASAAEPGVIDSRECVSEAQWVSFKEDETSRNDPAVPFVMQVERGAMYDAGRNNGVSAENLSAGELTSDEAGGLLRKAAAFSLSEFA